MSTNAFRWLRPAVCAAIVTAAACSSAHASRAWYDPNDLPAGPVGKTIAYGHALFVNTPVLMKANVKAGMSCEACHLAGGTHVRGGSLVGVYGRFPQWNKRSGRIIALQDRIAECFLRSMNGKPPAYGSKEMVAMVAYIAWLSRGIPVGTQADPNDSFVKPLPKEAPDRAAGAAIYAQRCEMCHQANGLGIAGTVPPLWGPKSFNSGAGMAHLDRMTGFVRYNMPQNAPGSLSMEQAFDVAAFVLGHARPRFHGNAPVGWPARAAKTF